MSTDAGGLAHGLAPEVLAGLETISRVARALVGSGTLAELGERALSDMREALELEAAVLYLPDATGRPNLERYVASGLAPDGPAARDELSFDPEAWRLAVTGGQPLVFHEPAGWLVANPFEPPAASWLVLPLVSARRMVGVVVASTRAPLALDPAGVTVLSLLGDLLSAGIATARLRQQLQRGEAERERSRLAAEVHDELAQDLALAVRELALLDEAPGDDRARASLGRLRQAVESAHRVVRARLEDLSVVTPLGGVQVAAHELCRRHERDGIEIRFASGGLSTEVSPEATAVVLRVLNESLANVVKHAGAQAVDVDLRLAGGRVALTVQDDGRGLEEEPLGPTDGHFGLTIMRARAREAGGALEVGPGPRGGTRVGLLVPIG